MMVAAVVLAAGRATRYRSAGGQADTKLVDLFRGEPLVCHAVRAALASLARPVVVVTGHAREAVAAACAGLPVTRVHNPAFAHGLASTLAVGLASLPAEAEGVVVLLGDMPLVSSAVIDALIGAAKAHPDAAAVVPTWNGERGNPVLLTRALFPRVAALEGDEGARRLLRGSGLVIRDVPVADPGVRLDIDEPSGFTG